MGKYEDLTKSFYEDYELPVIEDYIVGFSGLDPDRKIKPEEINHEKLDGLLGGDFSGRYHLTNDQVRKFTGYQGQIDSNKRDSETAITTLRSDTNSAITTLRNDTSQSISELRSDSEEAVSDLRREKNREIQSLSMDIDTAKSQMGYQVSQISARQATVETSQANISARFDEALEGVTEDSEVIDARVDAEDVRHVNLGANIRSLHRRVNASDGVSHERDEAIHGHLQEQADELAGEVLRHTLEIDEKEKRLSTAEASLERAHELILDETEKRESETEEGRKADEQLREEISKARKETTYRGEYLQEQAGALAGEILRLTLQREEDIQRKGKDIEDLRLGIMLARKLSTSRHDHLQEQSDDLAGALLDNAVETYRLGEKLKDETENRKSDTRYLTGEIASEAHERLLSDQALNDDMYEEYATRKKADDELRSDISASRKKTQSLYEELREEADTLSGEILRQIFEREADQAENARNLAHEENQRIRSDDHIQVQADELAAGLLSLSREVLRAYEKLKETGTLRQSEISQTSRKFYDWISSLQEQINELAYMKLSDIKANEELDGRLSVIEGEIDDMQGELDPTDTATDDEADEAIEDALSGEGIEVETEPEITEMLDEIFGVNP